VGDWTDIIDLDYTNRDLWDYQIDTLKMWAKTVDGFRCDVAPLVPMEFWARAREAVEEIRPGCIWLSESVEPGFITYLRSQNLVAHTDREVFEVFDIAYDYDIFGTFLAAVKGECSLSDYAAAVNRQETVYQDHYVKLRYLENHDQDRAAHLIPDERQLRNWTAFCYFQKGMTLLYAGQEVAQRHRPNLFDLDRICWNTGKDLSDLMTRLAELKRDPILTDSRYTVTALPDNALVAVHEGLGQKILGVFCMGTGENRIRVPVTDGVYENRITGTVVAVKDGSVHASATPIILACKVLE
jgi:glycosidase